MQYENRTLREEDYRPVLDYIRSGWNELTRAMDDCASLTDVKVMSHPVLYLPDGFAVPARVAEMQGTCYVQVRTLPRKIERMGDVKPEDLPAPGLLYLPRPYVVPGGRFNEMYGWDSYFILLGLLADGLHSLGKGIVDNFLFEIQYYGTVLNANRTYYLTRSQPPFLTAMIFEVYRKPHSFDDPESAHEWLTRAYRLASKYYETWTDPDHLAGDTGLARYFDLDHGPVPELADDSRYFHHVIQWLLDHPEQNPGYLMPTMSSNGHTVGRCNPQTGTMHEQACVNGFQLTPDFYLGDRAMRESGFDTTFRFGPFSGSTHHYAPVCLNSLLFRYEREMAEMAQEIGESDDIPIWNARATRRAEAIHKYLWIDEKRQFLDYNFRDGSSSNYSYLSTYYPMWAGLATKYQAAVLSKQLHLFEHSGGLAMSSTATGMQWDEPFGWAPVNWIASKGLYDYGFYKEAFRIAESFLETVNSSFAADATVREKYDVEQGNADVHVTAGYKDNVIGFGWTNGVYLKMVQMLNGDESTLPE